MLGLGLSLWNAALGGGGGGFSPLQLSDLAAWFRWNSGITETSGAVSQWDDASGNGRHPKQGTATNRPTKQQDGSIRFDGVDNYLKCDAFTLDQPYTIIIKLKQPSWTSADRLWDGNTHLSGASIQVTSSPRIGINSALATIASADTVLPLDTYGVICAIYNGASSSLVVDDGVAATGNPGTANPGGFILGAGGTPSNYGHLHAKEVIILDGIDAGQIAQAMAYLATLEMGSESLFIDENDWNSGAVTLPSAAGGKIFQRVGTSYTLTVSGQYGGTATAVEVQIVNDVGGATVVDWATLDASPADGEFSGTVSVPQGGMYRVKVRTTDAPSNVITSKGKIGVGVNILWIGQSNVQQMWGLDSGAVIQAGVVRFGGGLGIGWYNAGELEQIDEPTSGPGSQGFGGLGAATFGNAIFAGTAGVPVGLIELAISGTDIASWITGGSSWTTTLASFTRTAAPEAYEICVFQQGCANITAGTTKASYLTSLATLEAQVRTHSTIAGMLFGLCPIGQATSATEAQNDDIRQGILEYLDTNASAKTFIAYVMSDQFDTTDNPHYLPAQRVIFARRGATGVLKALGLASFGADGPKLAGTGTYDDATGIITLPVTQDGGSALREVDGGTAGTGLTGFVATSNVGVETITATSFSGNNVLLTVSTGKTSMSITYLYGEPIVTGPVYDNNAIASDTLPGRPLQPSRGAIVATVI